jgi:hypothetical protein
VNHRNLSTTALAAVISLGLLTSCGSDEPTTTPAASAPAIGSETAVEGETTVGETTPETQPADAAPVADTTAAAATTPDTAPADGMPDLTPFDICPTVPPLEVINTVLDEPATKIADLERGPGSELCEASGGTVDTVQFGRMTNADRAQLDQMASELGYPVSDLNDPTLPGAYTYAGLVGVIIDGTEWSVQVITFDTITDPTSPAAVERSAALLRAWLPLLGMA